MGLEIGKTVDGYEIVEILGSSKTGVAYKVRNVFAQRFEVLKILPNSVRDDEEQNARFLREIKVHAQLLHPNIVTFYNAREMEGQLVMTTEFVPGATLAERLEAGPIPWRDACQYAGQVLSALGYAHAHGIVHRGLSSSNLILTPEGNIRLTGFGLAKSAADPDLTAAGSVIGALKYMAPEQVKGEHIDGRSDLYSMGIVLYEMLTGKLPFAAKGQFEIMLAHVNTAPKHASDVNAEVPRELGDMVAKALAKSPDDRFSNAQEFRSAIEHITLPSETKPEAHAPVAEASLDFPPTVSEVPWRAPAPSATNGHVKHELPEASITALEPAPAHLETAQSFMEPLSLSDTPTPVSTSEPWDAWTFDTPPVTVESKPKPAEPEPSVDLEPPPVSEARAPVDVRYKPLIEPEPEFAESQAVAEQAEASETPSPVSASALWSAEAIEAALLSARSKLPSEEPEPPSAELAPVESPAPSALETSAPLIENSESEPEAPVSSSFLLDSWAINPDPAPVESTPAPAEVQSEEPAVEAAAQEETPQPISSDMLWDTWAVESALASAESELTPAEFQTAPHDLETVAPLVAPPAALHDPWTIEAKAPFAEPGPAEADLATALPGPVATAIADTPAAVPQPSLHDAWASESAPPPLPESQPTSPELHLLSAALETPAEAPALDWPAKPSDFWVHEPVQPPAESPRESTELKLLSAALEPQQELPPALPFTSEEPPAVESKPPAVELAAPSLEPEPAPAVAAAPVVVSAPAPVVKVKTMRPPNPDLLTALFGDTLLSRLSLILVVCAITFFLGTVTLFAVFSVTKP